MSKSSDSKLSFLDIEDDVIPVPETLNKGYLGYIFMTLAALSYSSATIVAHYNFK